MGKPKVDYSNFDSLDIRVGRVVSVEDSLAQKPTYKIRVNFGSGIGQKTTIGAYKNYTKEQLVGKLVVGLINVGNKKMGPEISEFLMLGVQGVDGKIIYLTPQKDVPLGVHVF